MQPNTTRFTRSSLDGGHLEQRATPIGPNDMLIAAQARSPSLIVATANIKEFARVPGLASENWLE